MPAYNDEALVLRTAKLGEADRIITLLTKNHGKVRAVAKGIRREKSRFGARLEPFMRDNLQLYQGKSSLQVVSQAVCTAPYATAIASDYEAYQAANLMVETADKLIADDGDALPGQYNLLLSAIHALATHQHPAWQISYSYVLRALAEAGWRASVSTCVVCSRNSNQCDLAFFSIPDGGCVCADDQSPASVPISAEQLSQLRALSLGDWAQLKPQPMKPVLQIVENWAQYYLEQSLHSANLLHSSYEH